MRIKGLMRYHLSTTKNALLIFSLCYLGGMLLASIISSLAVDVAQGARPVSGSVNIFSFVVFMWISSLIASQSDTRFLITRSVSRKEIYVSNLLFMIELGAVLGVMHMVYLCIDGFVRYLLGFQFVGLQLDAQYLMAPDMGNGVIFFLVSFSILVCFGALGYLFGSVFAKWKLQTIGVLIVAGLVLLSSIIIPGFLENIVDGALFLFSDEKTGMWMVAKHLALAVVFMAVTFPIMRRITAVSQNK